METLDVTKIEPRLKHPSIFNKFDALAGGQAFILHNDHDPVPLYYQMVAERGKTFEWEYLQKGPAVYEVKITKLDTGVKSKTMGELVTSDYRKAEVFRKFGLDFCCGGNRTVKEACDKKGLNVAEVEAAIAEVDKSAVVKKHDFNSWELDFLADYIVNTHHKYVREAMPMLNEFSAKVARVHGNTHPEVIEIAKHYNVIAEELMAHMPKEENILFPYIKEMVAAKRNGTPLAKTGFGSIKNPIQMMELEHTAVGESMEKVHELSGGYTPPSDACSSYKVLFAKLKEFEEDLHEHIHLENNILFSKAIKMEEELLSK
ncbi:MAG: iron-sulfur cluster repair di-iron protein [Bacteroidia bacterium]